MEVVGPRSLGSLTLSKLFNFSLIYEILQVHSLPRVGVGTTGLASNGEGSQLCAFGDMGSSLVLRFCFTAYLTAQGKTKVQVLLVVTCVVILSHLEARFIDEVEWDQNLCFTMKF